MSTSNKITNQSSSEKTDENELAASSRKTRSRPKNSLFNFSERTKKLLTPSIISIIVAGISGYIGFNITQFLSRDNVSIQDISIKHAEIQITLTSETIYALNNLKTGNIDIEERLNREDLFDFTTHELTEKNVMSILRYYKNTTDNLNIKINEQLQLLPKVAPKKDLTTKKDDKNQSGDNSIDEDFTTIGDNDASQNQNRIRAKISYYNNLNNKIDSVFKILIPEIVKQVNEHKSDYQIDVILYNSGDKQAVVKYNGELDFGGRHIQLTRKRLIFQSGDQYEKFANAITAKQLENSLPSQYIAIEPKSFNGLSLIVNDSKNSKNDIDESKNILLTRNKTARLTLTDISGSRTITKDFDFQLDSQDELSDYLKSDFNKYISSSL